MAKIPAKVKRLLAAGYAPHGIVIPNPQNAPRGSGVHSFRKRDGKQWLHVSLVIAPSGRVVRSA